MRISETMRRTMVIVIKQLWRATQMRRTITEVQNSDHNPNRTRDLPGGVHQEPRPDEIALLYIPI